jgi:type II secretion system protein L
MTTLRVLLAAPPSSARAEAWALFDSAGALVRSGRDHPDAWPAADTLEIVVAASQVRLALVTLPPLPPARVAQAAAYALEDELAGPADGQHLAASAQSPDGRVRVAVVARALMTALTDRGVFARLGRIVAEPELAAVQGGWRWCAAAADLEGFVRRSDGSAFSVSPVGAGGVLPAELALALDEARRNGTPPATVRVDAPLAPASLLRWKNETGVAFSVGAPWRWEASPPTAFAAAIDLRQGAFAQTPVAPRGARARLFVPALALVAASLALHVLATVVDWGALKLDGWRTTRAWTELAIEAGIPQNEVTDPSSARRGLARRYAELRHANGLPAPDDALPLLARAAPAFTALPAGAVKSATYADGHWTIDVARADPAQLAAFDARLRSAGVPAVLATSAAGARVRLGAL